MAKSQFDFDVFLSYSHVEEDRARRLAERLKERGLRIWADWSIKPGQEFHSAIDHGLASSRRVVACWSPTYWTSHWTRAERSRVLSLDPNNDDLRYIPVMLADCKPPDTFLSFKYLDYRTESETALLELLAVCSPHPPEEGLVQPLHVTEDRFLQVLLSDFSLRRGAKGGVELRLCFDDETSSIWSSPGKRYLLAKTPETARHRYQKELDDFLLKGHGKEYRFRDAHFWFRYASGGTLPIITLTDAAGYATRYYCMFYRDVYPIGWNIANGGCDNRAELLDPQLTIERELREEVIIADFEEDTRYVFGADSDPAHNVARRLWSTAHKVLDLTTLRTRQVPIEWHTGPDSLHIQVGRDEPIVRRGFYLNINGEDFGIEVDRIATIHLPHSVTLFDGELEGAVLVNSPVALFDTEKFDQLLREEKTTFRPDLFFFDAQKYDGTDGKTIDDVLLRFQEHVRSFRTPEETSQLQTSIEEGTQYGLCPVTARIIERHLRATGRWPLELSA